MNKTKCWYFTPEYTIQYVDASLQNTKYSMVQNKQYNVFVVQNTKYNMLVLQNTQYKIVVPNRTFERFLALVIDFM